MELKEFVSETIKQVIDGVVLAQGYASSKGARVNSGSIRHYNTGAPDALLDKETGRLPQVIDFDVAVTTSEGTQTKGSAGIFVGAIGIGAQGLSDHGTASVSRIRFRVPVLLSFVE